MLKLLKPYKRPNEISCVVVLVAFNTYDWIVPCLTDLRKFMPKIDVVVANNNPSRADKARLKSFSGRTVYGQTVKLTEYTEKENKWLQSAQKDLNIKVVDTPWFMDHGRAVDWMVKDLEHDAFVHIEPDCEISGPVWFKNLRQGLCKSWMASGYMYPSREIHPTPSIWRLDVWRYLNLSFVAFPRKVFTGQDALFYKIIDTHRLLRTHQNHWDTGIYASYRCSRKKKAQWVPTPDIVHHYRGSVDRK